MFGTSIQSEMLDAPEVKIDLKDVHQLSELREYQDLMASSNQLGQHSIQEFEFATRSVNVISHILLIEIVKEQVRVIANLPKLHYSIPQS